MNIEIKEFLDFDVKGLYNLMKLRVEVFVVEQKCPYLELDGKDEQSIHFLIKDHGELIAYLRILPAGLSYREVSIGRVLVSEKYRKRGYGRELMNKALDYIKENNLGDIRISAQDYLRGFYESLGFKKISEVYLEDNIPHIEMLKKM